MSRIRVRGFKIFKDRHGKQRCYHRKTGHKIDLTEKPIGSAEFIAECARISALAEAQKTVAPKRGTLAGLLQAYFETEHFKNLSHRTKKDYRKCADFVASISDTPVPMITTPLVAGIHDKAATKIGWRQANMLRTFLSQVFQHCVPKGLIERDFAADVIRKPRPKAFPYANRPWTPKEQATVLERAEPHVAVAIALMRNTGLDPSDALGLLRSKIDGDMIWGQRGKTGEEIAIPIGRTLRTALDGAPKHAAITVLANSRGKPWTYDGFSTVWQKLRKTLEAEEAIKPGLTLKGLRHTVATVLREAGLDEREIADLLGQKSPSMARHYSRSANLADRNRKTVETLELENERRSENVKPFPKSVKP